jgi:pyruvate formate lyase activating enzyme
VSTAPRPHCTARELEIGGYVPLSTTDLPGQLAAVVFCQGCPWRCGYCHNPHLQPPRADQTIEWNTLHEILLRRRGLIDAVVFSGGEPTAQAALLGAISEVRGMGFRVGLHTAGIYPRRLKRLLPLVDWVGFDVKASFAEYASVTGVAGSAARAVESLRAVLASRVECEIRTTVHPDLMAPDSLVALAQALAGLGVRRYVVQEFRAQGCADTPLRASGAKRYLDDGFCGQIGRMFETFDVRRG